CVKDDYGNGFDFW
nr:immunoglobulin heavy chain junction region [Macaca mulatta]MOX95904.1 immunoglobulin heavy chain junction region [Macaca mulatta]